MNQDWILQNKETRRTFSKSTWVPLRASINNEKENCKYAGFVSEYFGCGSVAFPPEHREIAEKASWSDIGISCTPPPLTYNLPPCIKLSENDRLYSINGIGFPMNSTCAVSRDLL